MSELEGELKGTNSGHGVDSSSALKITKELDSVMYDIARAHLVEARLASEKVETAQDSHGKSAAKDEELKHSLVTILMCALCLETYVNSLGIRGMAELPDWPADPQKNLFNRMMRFMWRGIEQKRLNLVDKWQEIPPLVSKSNKGFDNKSILKGLIWLKNTRNRIVHYKAVPKPITQQTPELESGAPIPHIYEDLSYKNAEKAINIVKATITGFHRDLDSTEPPAWLS